MKQEPDIDSNNQSVVEYLTRKEAALFLRISLAKFDQIKDLDRIKFGKSVRFNINSLREYAVNHTIKGI